MVANFSSSLAAALGAFLLGVSLTGDPGREYQAFSHTPSADRSHAPSADREQLLTDEDRYEIILTVLRSIDPKNDHVMERSKNYSKGQAKISPWVGGDIVYLSTENLPNIAVERLPKEKLRYKLVLGDKSPMFNRVDHSYLKFSGWGGTRESAIFTQTASFRGGNVGGCMEKYSKNGRSWKREKPDCFAMAS